jgi:hypothetical protein
MFLLDLFPIIADPPRLCVSLCFRRSSFPISRFLLLIRVHLRKSAANVFAFPAFPNLLRVLCSSVFQRFCLSDHGNLP